MFGKISNAICILVSFMIILFSFYGCSKGGNIITETKQSYSETTVGSSVEEKTEVQTTATVYEKKEYPLNDDAKWINLLGERSYISSNSVVCDWTCSGMDFDVDCKGDVIFSVKVSNNCYFRAYVDGEEWLNGNSAYYEVLAGSGKVILKDLSKGVHNIKIIKVTGYTLANAEFTKLTLTGRVIEEKTEDKELLIEFVGDSISCGYGVIGNYRGDYESQDGTLAYPYLIANELDADYSIVALSGQGVACGDPNLVNSYKYASHNRGTSKEFSFERKADIVIVNLGTNDYTNNVSPSTFRAEYIKLLEYIREKNGEDCIIIALYNMMNDGHGMNVDRAIEMLGGEDNGYYVYKMNRTAKVYTSHPTAEENYAYTEVILGYIDDILNS